MLNSVTRVLYLSYDGLTDPLGQSQILPYLCGLSKEYSITVVSFEKKTRFEKERKIIEKVCEDNNLNWVPLVYHKSPPVLSTVYDLWRLKKKVRSLHKISSFRIVHCRSYITSLAGLWMKNKYGTKFIFDMRGFWADERVEGGLWNLNNPIYRLIYSFFKKKERQFLKNSDYVISLTESAKNEIVTWGVKTSISVIPCCVDLELFNPQIIEKDEQAKLRKELGLKSVDFVLLYLGSLGTWYLMDDMLSYFTEVRKQMPNAKFLIITPDKFVLENYPYNNDVLVKYASRIEVPLYVSLASASIIFVKPSFSKKASSATKLAEILAMGKRAIVNAGWGDISVYEAEFTGIFTISNSSDRSDSIHWLTSNLNTSAIRESARHFFSLDYGIAKYEGVYKTLCLGETDSNCKIR